MLFISLSAINPKAAVMNRRIQKPKLLHTLMEARVPFEIGAHILSRRFYEKNLPQGEGRAVIVIPGFGAGDFETKMLRQSLRRLGYRSVPWKMGRNMGTTSKNRAHLHSELKRLMALSGQKISIVGWSLGGVFARELGRKFPENVHSVVSLGTPFTGDHDANILHDIFQRISGSEFTNEDLAAFNQRKEPPGVISTSIYSKSDGVVSWQCSLEEESELTENIEVVSSHSGLVFNPLAISALAHALQK